jgi:hypothetical protein
MCSEASAVLRAVAADFFFNCWCLEIPSDNRIRHIPRFVHYLVEGIGSLLLVHDVLLPRVVCWFLSADDISS